MSDHADRPGAPGAPAEGADDSDRTQVVTGGAGETASVRPAVAAPTATRATNSDDAGLLAVGARIAEFEVTRVVGQGGFGVVYEAWDPTLERVVAIKEYLPTSLSTRQGDGTVAPLSERHRETFELGMRSFINEARLLAQFDHPSLLKVYRFWQERGTTYMVMPFYRGDTLRQALAGSSRPGGVGAAPAAAGVDEGWLMRIMDGVTQALGVMHAASCYHRDIAPDNIILLEGSGRPVVLDFGAARRVITDKTQAITVILKPGYAPIEQYAEMPDMTQGAWTDVYALAAVMHVAVCGRSPPPSVARLLSDSYVPLAGNEFLRQRYSPQLLAAIDAGLGVRPEQRPQSMAELRALLGLEGAVTGAPLRTTMDSGAAAQGAGPRPSSSAVTNPSANPSANFTANPSARRPAAASAHGHRPGGPAPGRGRAVAIAAAVAIVAVLAGGGWWLQGRGDGEVAVGATATPPAATPPSAPSPPPPVAVAPAAPPPVAVAPRTPGESLQALEQGATPGFTVRAKPGKAEVAIGKDKLAFEVASAREGYVYVYLLSSGGELFLLFPNLLDKYNKIAANTPLSLPRASWPMNAGGPAGTNRFVVLVSEHERDFGGSGIQNDGVFPQFPLPVLAALEAARGSGPSPLQGRPQCPAGAPCKDVYGTAGFSIVER